jgi:Apea-like HEPN
MATQKPLGFKTLKQKQRAIRKGFPEQLGLRTHRALSWLQRAELETEDADVRFILLWISFNAAFAADLKDDGFSTRDEFRAFFEGLIERDKDKRIYNAVWNRFSQEIRLLLSNRYVFASFWHHHNGVPGYADWEAKLAASNRITADALVQTNTLRILTTGPWRSHLERHGQPQSGNRRRCSPSQSGTSLHRYHDGQSRPRLGQALLSGQRRLGPSHPY